MVVFQSRLLLVLYLSLLGLFVLGELVLIRKRIATEGQASGDRRFLKTAVPIFVLSNLVAILCIRWFPGADFGTHATAVAGLLVMGIGMPLRWWSIAQLGRFFTVNVAVASDQRVIDSGPYRLIRHPAYSGLLLTICGMALRFGNFVSAAVILVPFVVLIGWRIKVEEAALVAGLGDSYREYMQRTKRLIPGVY